MSNDTESIADLARQIWGEPNKSLSSKDELRFGTNGSKSVNLKDRVWFDHEAGKGGGYADLYKVVHREPARATRATIAAVYDYQDATGRLVFQVVRLIPKTFRQRRPNGAGGWIWDMKGVQRVPYRLPDLLRAAPDSPVFLCEGEKDSDNLWQYGLVATCNPGGAGNWQASYNQYLRGRRVVVLADNDIAGTHHAAEVARHLRGVATAVAILKLPGLPPKGDVSDWLAAGGTAEALERLASEAETAQDETPEGPDAAPEAEGEGDYDLTEDGLALAFAAKHGDVLRFDHNIGKWHHWTGRAWRPNETKLAFSWARQICREIANAGGVTDKLRATLCKAATAAAVERFAQADPALAVTSKIWDQNPFLLGTPGGTVDLRTGELHEANREDHITRLTAVAPEETPDCPRWLAFLDQVTNGDKELIRFLQQWCGYCLTGDTREHALLFVYGPGGNGKSVFLNTVSGILGEYARTAAMDTFTASQTDKHPTDLAMLRGARLVMASETEEGRAWAESRIKSMTGGDIISARFMRQDFFEYLPQFKLTVIGNHKPILRNIDEAARRRFNVVPFVYTPPKKDMQLESKLKAEWPAILRWMVDGCLDWQRGGLVRPQSVLAATAAYFEEQDQVAQWIAESCDVGPRQSEKLVTLFHSWSEFAVANGEKAGTAKWFSQTMQRLGFEAVKNTPGFHGHRGFRGIAVRHAATPSWTEAR